MTMRQSDRNAEIARRYAAGERPSRIAKEFGITGARVSQIVKEGSGPRAKRQVDADGVQGRRLRAAARIEHGLNPPFLKLVSGYIWSCAGDGVVRSGSGFDQAYDRWLAAAIYEAAQRSRGTTPAALDDLAAVQATPRPKRQRRPKVEKETKPALADPIALPRPAPEPFIGVPANVRVMPSVYSRPEYTLPPELVRARLRAEAWQPDVRAPTSTVKYLRKFEETP